MLHKAAHSFSPFKLQHLHSHIRSALNLNLGQNAGQNFNQANASTSGAGAGSANGSTSSSSSSSSLGGQAAQPGGAGGNAKYHPGRSYGHYYFHRTTTPAANAASTNDGPAYQKSLADDEEDANLSNNSKLIAHANRNLRYRTGRRFAGRQRSSSLSNPGLTTGLPLDSNNPSSTTTTGEQSHLPRSSPYSFNQAQLQARYRHAFSQAKRPSHERLLTSSPSTSSPTASTSTAPSQTRSISTSTSRRSLKSSSRETPKTAPSSPRTRPSPLPTPARQQVRRNSTSTTQAPPAINEDVINSASTLSQPAEKTISTEQPAAAASSTAETAASDHVTATLSPEEAAGIEGEQALSTPEQSSLSDIDSSTLRWQDLQTSNSMQFTDADKAFQREFMKLARYQEVSQIKTMLRLYRDSPEEWTSNKHSAVIFGMINLIRPFDSKFANDTIIQFYKDFYNHNDMIPSIYTLSMVSSAYLNRSLGNWEQYERLKLEENAWKLASSAKEWLSRLPTKGQGLDTSSLSSSSPEQAQGPSEELLATLKQESEKDYQSARTIMYTLGKELKIFPTIPLEQLVKAAAVRGDIDTALRAFGTLEGTPKNKQSRVTYRTYLYLLTAYAKGGDARGVRTIFESFANSPVITYKPALTRRKSASSFLEQSSNQLDPEADKIFGEAQAHSRETQVDVCNAAIYAYLLLGDGVKALDVLERMMSSRQDIEKNVVPPNGNTLLHLVKGFAESGDLESAFRWATRIHAEPKPQDLPEPPSMNETVDSIIAATSDAKAVEAAAGDSPVLPKLATRVYDLTYGPTLSTNNIGAQEQGSPSLSENSSAGNRTELGSIFSDPSMRSRTLSITPPPRVRAGYASSPNGKKLQPDSRWSHELDDIIRSLRRNEKLHSASHAYLKIKENAKNGVHAHPETLARFLYILAKSDAGSTGAVHEIYKMALDGLAGLDNPADQAAAWAYIEDRMLSYAATVGELAEAAQHRDRLLAAGAAPSADSYAAMIVSAKDTTDDATVAIELFEEARRFGVVPNLFLFNILIGKVSKARRTQLALSYFEQMKAVGIKPSTVTYGSVIAACCRTGDEKAAVYLFNEMLQSHGYKPRVPPYNTMIQFYISTKQDREKALSYFDSMLRAGVAPSAHTYKLLLDAYGSIEPVDLDSVKDVFARLLSDPNIRSVTSAHWASLIHTYGSVKKDLDKTLEIFDSIAQHPSSKSADVTLPDVTCYEALFSALIAMKKTDLLETYLTRMRESFVQPNAYLWNVVIKAYTVADNIEKAREVFESLADPAAGVAAAGNHSSETGASPREPGSVVYREPSTYECMIRAEMKIGSPERAKELLNQAIGRAFPPAIIAKLERIVNGEDVSEVKFSSGGASNIV